MAHNAHRITLACESMRKT
ncbi:hypothetical protein [Paraburkholderia kururiensis]